MWLRAAIVHIIYSKMGIDQMPNFKTTVMYCSSDNNWNICEFVIILSF